MRIGDAHNANRSGIGQRQPGRTSKMEESLVKGVEESSERRGEEIVGKGSTMEWRGHGSIGGGCRSGSCRRSREEEK